MGAKWRQNVLSPVDLTAKLSFSSLTKTLNQRGLVGNIPYFFVPYLEAR